MKDYINTYLEAQYLSIPLGLVSSLKQATPCAHRVASTRSTDVPENSRLASRTTKL